MSCPPSTMPSLSCDAPARPTTHTTTATLADLYRAVIEPLVVSAYAAYGLPQRLLLIPTARD